MLNLQTTQVWTAVRRFGKSTEEDGKPTVIGYALRLDGDTSPTAFLVDFDTILNNFNVISNGEELPYHSTKVALDAMVRDA